MTRRDFLRAGGLALAGLTVAPPLHRHLWARRGEVVEIAMRSDAAGGEVWFDPLGVLIDPGQTVRWIVVENVHTTTAYHPANGVRQLRIPPAGQPWDSGYLVNPGEMFETQLTAEGVYDYLCIPHEAAGMVGRIVVGDPQRSPAPAFDARLPAAARRAFPSVGRIMTEKRVRR